MKKYRVPVYIKATATKCIGYVECDSLDEFDDKADELWKSEDYDYPASYHGNDFDMSDWDIDPPTFEDLEYCKNQPAQDIL